MTNPITPDCFILNWDLNGTVTFGDTTKNINEIIGEVAGVIKAKWEGQTEEMSWKEYVQNVLVTGNKYDPATKDKQESKISGFLKYLREHEHLGREYLDRHIKARELYESLAANYLNPETNRATFAPFNSVVHLINRINQVTSCFSHLRTFGNDGPLTAEEFSKKGITFNCKAEFTPEGIQINGEDQTKNGVELFKTIQKQNILGHDQVDYWLDNKRQAEFGKRIYCVADAQFEGKNVVSIIFDDNITKKPKQPEKIEQPADPHEQNIAFPVDIYGNPVSWDSKGFIGIRVNPIKAATNDDYFIKKLNKQLEKRGFTKIT